MELESLYQCMNNINRRRCRKFNQLEKTKMKNDLLKNDRKALMICCMALGSNGYSQLEMATMLNIPEAQIGGLLIDAHMAMRSNDVKQMDMLNMPPDIKDLITGGY